VLSTNCETKVDPLFRSQSRRPPVFSLILWKRKISKFCDIRYVNIEAATMRGESVNSVSKDPCAKSHSLGLNLRTNCVIIRNTIEAKNPTCTALKACFFP